MSRVAFAKRKWAQIENQKAICKAFEKANGIETQEDWYKVTNLQFRKFEGGSGVLAMYQFSIYSLLKTVYPEREWYPWLFKKASTKFWNSESASLEYVKWLEKDLQISQVEQWYDVDFKAIKHRKGFQRAVKNRGILQLLKTAYPDYAWMAGRFRKAFPDTWTHTQTAVEFVKYVEPSLQISNPIDWYRVSRRELQEVGLSGLYKRKRLFPTLSKLYPDFKFDEDSFSTANKQSSQRLVYLYAKQLFPNELVIENHLHEELIWKGTHQKMQLDVWIPNRKLGFEYQGEHHYYQLNKAYGPGFEQLELARDRVKAELCRQHGIALVLVPYWWDRTLESMQRLVAETQRSLKSVPVCDLTEEQERTKEMRALESCE